jgi:phosphoadenosine phosphosulfate reductase
MSGQLILVFLLVGNYIDERFIFRSKRPIVLCVFAYANSERCKTGNICISIQRPNAMANPLEKLPELEQQTAQERVSWALDTYGERIVLASSFGAQSAVMLHLVSQLAPKIPVVLTDTGYLFPETYQFVDLLTQKLDLNLQVYSAQESSAWQEARWGKRWEQGIEGLDAYNALNKVEPMRRALDEHNAEAWLSGVRSQQSSSRAERKVLELQNGRYKVHPILDWTDRDVFLYLKEHDLPYHPLWEQGYVSIGDWHTSKPLTADMAEEDTRFFGLKRECGLHQDV